MTQPVESEVPERIWHSGSLQIAMQAGSWFDRKDLTLPEREQRVAQIISDFAESITRAHVTSIITSARNTPNVTLTNLPFA